MSDPIEDHYDRFPYPDARCVVPSGDAAFAGGMLSFLLRRRASDWISPRSIWVAGCGTVQASQWALTFPGAEVLATDVSEGALEIARSIAREVGANVRFERHDLRAPIGRTFDLVFCTGVVHHMPDPREGLRNVRDAIGPSGAALVMVYSRTHREALDPIRRAIARLCPGDYERACELLGAAIGPRCRPDHREMLEVLYSMREKDRSFVADLLVNPREESYDLAGMHALIESAGLRFVEWRHPGSWRAKYFFDDAALVGRAEALGPRAEAELIYDLAGLASPMFDALVERDDAPVRAPYTDQEILAMRMRVRGDERQLDLKDGRFAGEQRFAPFEAKDGLLVGLAAGGHGSSRHFAIPRSALPLIEACDGTRTVAELCDAFAHLAPPAQLLAMITELSPRDVGLLAPLVVS